MLSLIRAAAGSGGALRPSSRVATSVSASISAAALRTYHSRKGCYGFRVPPKATPEEGWSLGESGFSPLRPLLKCLALSLGCGLPQ